MKPLLQKDKPLLQKALDQNPVTLPPNRPDYNRLMVSWQKFRDLTFLDQKLYLRHADFKFIISQAIAFKSLEEAFKELEKGLNWFYELE